MKIANIRNIYDTSLLFISNVFSSCAICLEFSEEVDDLTISFSAALRAVAPPRQAALALSTLSFRLPFLEISVVIILCSLERELKSVFMGDELTDVFVGVFGKPLSPREWGERSRPLNGSIRAMCLWLSQNGLYYVVSLADNLVRWQFIGFTPLLPNLYSNTSSHLCAN